MTFTQQQVDDYERKRRQGKYADVPAENVHRSEHVTDELKLHDEIIAWCNKQHPRIKYIHARTDRRSTIATGAHDFTIFFPNGKTICIEVKSKTGKLSTEQLAWRAEMKRLSHVIFVVRAFGEFECIADAAMKGWELPLPLW
jgi:hypothetical protein